MRNLLQVAGNFVGSSSEVDESVAESLGCDGEVVVGDAKLNGSVGEVIVSGGFFLE